MTAKDALVDLDEHVNLCPRCRAAVRDKSNGFLFSRLCDRARDMIEIAYKSLA